MRKENPSLTKYIFFDLKKILFFSVYFIFLTFTSLSQTNKDLQVTIDAFILDFSNNKPIAFAEIKLADNNSGTLSDEKGKFSLIFIQSKVDPETILKITSPGYDTISVKLDRVYSFLENTNKFYLKRSSKYIGDRISESNQLVTGRIFSAETPIQGAIIKVKNKYVESRSDFNGNFKIAADLKDELIINFLGMNEKIIRIENFENNKIQLETNSQILDEVTINSYLNNLENFETGYGKKNKKSIGYAVSSISADDISSANTRMVDLIRRSFSNVQVTYNEDQIYVRGGTLSINNPAAAIYDVEGIIYKEVPAFLDTQRIQSITLLKSLAATNRYGSEGRGGVFLIKLKSLSKGKRIKNKDLIKIKGNIYNENIPLLNLDNLQLTYIQKLYTSNSLVDLRNNFYTIEELYTSDPIFYLESYKFFYEIDHDFAKNIAYNFIRRYKDSSILLKAIAFIADEIGDYETENEIHRRLIKIHPENVQPYRDLALTYTKQGKYNLASFMYNYIIESNSNISKTPDFQKILYVEASNLLLNNFTPYTFSAETVRKLKSFYSNNKWKSFGSDYRIIFEWNDPFAEFNIQFVDPSTKYFNWTHSSIENENTIENELMFGYNSKDFFIDDDMQGTWLINLENYDLANKEYPVFLKYTVVKNYAKSNEEREVKTVELNKLLNKVTIGALKNN